MKKIDQVKEILEINTGKNTVIWHPEKQAEFSLLWPAFIGSVSWPCGYWVYHPLTTYLDVQMVDEGRLILDRDGHETVITGPALVIIPPGEHKLAAGSSGVCRKRYLGIQGAVMNNNLAALHLNKVLIIPNFHSEKFEKIYRELLRIMQEKDLSQVAECSSLVYQLLLFLSHCAEGNTFPDELDWAMIFIRREFARINSLEDICLHCNKPKSTLQWQFRRYLNTTPIQYLTEVRMNCAAKLLKTTTAPVKEISEKCGYSDQLYFSSAFKKYFHCSPRSYRKINSGISGTPPEK